MEQEEQGKHTVGVEEERWDGGGGGSKEIHKGVGEE